jgi:P27 family predicted phage terminase small subunit
MAKLNKPRGFAAATDEEKKRKGTFQPVRGLANKGVIQLPVIEIGNPPEDLDADEQSAWEIHAPILNKLNVITEADMTLVRELAILYARMNQATYEIKTHGLTYSTETGYRKNPAIEVYNSTHNLYMGICSEIGIGVRTRQRITSVGTTKEEQKQTAAGQALTAFLQGKPDINK